MAELTPTTASGQPSAEHEFEATEEALEDLSQGRATLETLALLKLQAALAKPPVVRTARVMSLFGEHAVGWLAIGAVGALVDRRRRGEWVASATGVAAAHAASIAVKRVVRRQRTTDPAVQVLVSTPSKLSFPSSHATSTAAAAVLYGELTGKKLTPALVPPMMLSRLVLGVHYPSDVAVGSALGGAVALGVRKWIGRRRNRG